MKAITPEELSLWSRYIHELCGVYLDASKGYLLETRLGSLLRETQAGGFAELYHRAKADLTHSLRRKIIDAITTNETSFFRDTAPFELLRHKLLPELIDRRRASGVRPLTLRLWSAACSTGQEVYSIAMVFKELLGDLSSFDIRILGTDISDQAVAAASYGAYSRLELDRGLADEKLRRHFQPAGDRWKVKDELRGMATFRTFNLLSAFSFPVPFDIILCRNVAIYFTEPDKLRLFQQLGKHLARDGALIIGSTESLTGLCPEFEPQRYLRSVYYQLKARPELRAGLLPTSFAPALRGAQAFH